VGNQTIAYDAENRQVAFCTSDPTGCPNTAGAGRTLYRYDGEGRRVQRINADGTQTVFAYTAEGQLGNRTESNGNRPGNRTGQTDPSPVRKVIVDD
jgi:YD repeat-containing protein